jgi:integrase
MTQQAEATDALARDVRLYVFGEAADTGRVPQPPEIATALERSQVEVEQALRRLAEGKVLILAPNDGNIREIIPALEKAGIEWRGYHAFRRGLATNLRALNVDDLTIMEILRHSDVSVTRASYIKRVGQKSIDAMDRLEAEIRKPVKKAPKSVRRRRVRIGVA